MEQRKSLKEVLKRLYSLLDWKQKRSFLLIVFIMILSAGLSQLTPKAIGWLTDDILGQSGLDFSGIIPLLLFILAVNVFNELIKIWRRIIVEDTATKTEKKARGMAILSLLRAPLSYFKKNMTGNIHGRLNRCLEGTVKLEKLIFMDFAPAIFNSIAAVVVIFTTLPVILALPMLLVIPIGTAIVLRQIKTQKGIRVELLETKAAMDGTVVELLNGIEVIRILDSADREKERFDGRSEFLRAKEMKHHIQMAKYDSLKFINERGPFYRADDRGFELSGRKRKNYGGKRADRIPLLYAVDQAIGGAAPDFGRAFRMHDFGRGLLCHAGSPCGLFLSYPSCGAGCHDELWEHGAAAGCFLSL